MLIEQTGLGRLSGFQRSYGKDLVKLVMTPESLTPETRGKQTM